MKKLIFVFVALFVLVLISGCNARNSNTVRFDDKNSADITSEEMTSSETEENVDGDTVITNETETETEKPAVIKEPSGKLEVLSFDGGFLKTNLNYNVINGGTSSDTYTIKINDYELQKYVPGTNEWSYVASSNHGTMKEGWNNYVVKTYDKDAKQIDSLMFSIEYAPVTADALPGVGSNHYLILILSLISSSIYFGFRKLRWL